MPVAGLQKLNTMLGVLVLPLIPGKHGNVLRKLVLLHQLDIEEINRELEQHELTYGASH